MVTTRVILSGPGCLCSTLPNNHFPGGKSASLTKTTSPSDGSGFWYSHLYSFAEIDVGNPATICAKSPASFAGEVAIDAEYGYLKFHNWNLVLRRVVPPPGNDQESIQKAHFDPLRVSLASSLDRPQFELTLWPSPRKST